LGLVVTKELVLLFGEEGDEVMEFANARCELLETYHLFSQDNLPTPFENPLQPTIRPPLILPQKLHNRAPATTTTNTHLLFPTTILPPLANLLNHLPQIPYTLLPLPVLILLPPILIVLMILHLATKLSHTHLSELPLEIGFEGDCVTAD
jgi:hypothetical protein